MEQVTDIKQVKADLAGAYAVQLSLVVDQLEEHVKLFHRMDHGFAMCITYGDCQNETCNKARLLIHNTRRLIEQGV